MKLLLQHFFKRKKRVDVPSYSISRRRLDFSDKINSRPIYAIGDVHGRLDLLLKAERKIFQDMEVHGTSGLIILLGDVIDRGPDSCAVIDYLLKPPPQYAHRIVLCGNHEAALLDFLDDPGKHQWWLKFGGRQTLLSYGIDADYFLRRGRKARGEFVHTIRNAIPPEHLAFLAKLPVSVRIGRILFVHAGVRPGIPIAEQSDHDMMWIREPFLSEGPKLPPYIVIHGHTPGPELDIGKNRICIDTGAVTTNKLSILKLLDEKAFILT